jgi:hypothetical protein
MASPDPPHCFVAAAGRNGFTQPRSAVRTMRLGPAPLLKGGNRSFAAFGDLMNYQAFTNDSLTMMYQGVRGALAADDALSELQGIQVSCSGDA